MAAVGTGAAAPEAADTVTKRRSRRSAEEQRSAGFEAGSRRPIQALPSAAAERIYSLCQPSSMHTLTFRAWRTMRSSGHCAASRRSACQSSLATARPDSRGTKGQHLCFLRGSSRRLVGTRFCQPACWLATETHLNSASPRPVCPHSNYDD